MTNEQDTTEVAQREDAIYERLKPQLEPEHSGKAIAIHVDTGDYRIHQNWAVARHEVRALHPDGMIYSLFIGPPTEREAELMQRIVGTGRKP
jgi:hypothetical protein